MLAVGTNVIVRYLLSDHPVQSARARRLIESEIIWIGTTVVLETAWVLRSIYGFPYPDVALALRRFVGLPSVVLESEYVVAQALSWFEQGMDFADAIHLAVMDGCEAMVSFDKAFAKAAQKCGTPPVRSP